MGAIGAKEREGRAARSVIAAISTNMWTKQCNKANGFPRKE